MRTRYLISLSITTAILLTVLWRQHILAISEVGRTYSTFHKYLRLHPEILVRYPVELSSPQADSITLDEPTPKVIHQIFLSNGAHNASLSKYEPAIKSCRALHPNWTFNLWTDDNATEFMRRSYPEILPHYTGYAQHIQRANILRYALLHHFGGVYLDLDVTCRIPLDKPFAGGSDRSLAHLSFITPGAYPAGVNNAFILARANHPFLTELLNRVASRDLHWPMPYVENMLSTGCMFFSNVWMSYALGERWRVKEDRIYILADEKGSMEPHMLRGKITTPLFEHGGASSWHGWDAAMIVTIGKHYGYCGVALAGMVVMIVVGVWCLMTRCENPHRRATWRSVVSRFRFNRRGLEKQRLLQDEEQELR